MTEKNSKATLTLGIGHDTVDGKNVPKLIRYSFLNAFQARVNQFNGKEEFSTTILIPKDNMVDVGNLQRTIKELVKATWYDNKKNLPPGFWNCMRDGDTDVKQDGSPMSPECKGHYVINAKSDTQPGVVGTTKDQDGKLIAIGPRDIKSGDWGRVSISLYAYTKGSGGIAAGLGNIQMVRQGEAFSNRPTADAAFGEFADSDEADPLA